MASTPRRRRSSYDLVPPWVRTKRVVALIAAAALLFVGVFAVRLLFGLAHLTRQNPISVLGDLVGGQGSSVINQSASQMRRINFAIYGYGGPGHDGPFLTDSILVVSIQPQPNAPPAVAEISVPRDWFVPIQLGNGTSGQNTSGQDRINQAFADGVGNSSDASGGAAVANPTLAHVLGLHIDHWVGVDFEAFRSAVNAVGGVDLVVPDSFTDDQYPAGECNGTAEQNCAYKTIHFDAGLQHMDGETALEFSRSRHSNDNGEGTDFARSRRQQLVIAALKQKAVSLGGVGSLPDLLNSLGDNVVTDLHVNDLTALYSLVKDVNPATVRHVSLDDTNFLYECGYPQDCGAAYLYAHDRTYQNIAHYLQSVFVEPAVLKEHSGISVEDASGRGNGASTRWASLFGHLGLSATDTGPVHRQPTTQVIDESGGKDAKTAGWLAHYFGVSVSQPAPVVSGSGRTTPVSNSSGGVVVILGQDEEHAFLDTPGVGR